MLEAHRNGIFEVGLQGRSRWITVSKHAKPGTISTVNNFYASACLVERPEQGCIVPVIIKLWATSTFPIAKFHSMEIVGLNFNRGFDY